MKKFIGILCAVMLIVSVFCACAEEAITTAFDDKVITKAIEAVKECWRDKFDDDSKGELSIRHTRVIHIKEDLSGAGKKANELFGDVECIVGFVLFTDYMGTSPYLDNYGVYDHVIVRKDGSCEVTSNPINRYRQITYNTDYSGFIDYVSDYGADYNADFALLEEKRGLAKFFGGLF